MTLCVAWLREVATLGPQLILMTDSLLTGGLAYPHGAKLNTFRRDDCAICWEGEILFTYSMTDNLRNDIDHSDALSGSGTSIKAVAARAKEIFDDLWAANLADADSKYHDAEFSFIFGGYDFRRTMNRAVPPSPVTAWHIHFLADRSAFELEEIDEAHLRVGAYFGSGAGAARQLASGGALTPYEVLRQVIDDSTIVDVGGMPQVVTVDRRGTEIVGLHDDQGRRYLFGKNVKSSGHLAHIRYINVNGADL